MKVVILPWFKYLAEAAKEPWWVHILYASLAGSVWHHSEQWNHGSSRALWWVGWHEKETGQNGSSIQQERRTSYSRWPCKNSSVLKCFSPFLLKGLGLKSTETVLYRKDFSVQKIKDEILVSGVHRSFLLQCGYYLTQRENENVCVCTRPEQGQRVLCMCCVSGWS